MSDGICPFATVLQGADWGENGSRTLAVRAVTVHMTEGTNSVGLGQTRHHNTPGTFNFLTSRDGGLWQFYPAHVRCSHAAGANQAGPGIENEGFTGNSLTDAQTSTLGRLCHWLAETYPVPLTYRTGDPRTYVDQSGYSGFIAHRAVDYPPDHSLLHFDEITPAEWQTAVGVPKPHPTLEEEDVEERIFVDGRGWFIWYPTARVLLEVGQVEFDQWSERPTRRLAATSPTWARLQSYAAKPTP